MHMAFDVSILVFITLTPFDYRKREWMKNKERKRPYLIQAGI